MSSTEDFESASWVKPVADVRRVTLGSSAAQRAARQYAGDRKVSVKRIEALHVAKRAAAAMGLKAAKIAMIDKLFGYSPADDWTRMVASPIVRSPNDALARQLGLSVSTARHHLRGLAAAGLIAHSSHPTFQRRGGRDKDGNVVDAFGIDLSQIIMRYDELLAVAEAHGHEHRERRSTSYRRTQIRREIEAVLEAARREELIGNWQPYQARLIRLLESDTNTLDQFHELIGALTVLRDDAENAFSGASSRLNSDTAVTGFRRVQTTAEPSSLKFCKPRGPQAGARPPSSSFPPNDTPASEKEFPQLDPSPRALRPARYAGGVDMSNVSLSLIRSACPAVVQYAPDAFGSWGRLREAGRSLCVAVGINLQIWQEVQAELDPDAAISALVVIFQKTDDGGVLNPGACLWALNHRGSRGDLRVSRSLFALASARGSMAREKQAFLETGSIHYTRFADIARESAPKPTRDVDMLARAFRTWAAQGHIDLRQQRIDKAFIGFCRKWRPQCAVGLL